MLSHPAAVPLSIRSLNHLAGLIRAHRQQRRSRWRRLDPSRQSLLALGRAAAGLITDEAAELISVTRFGDALIEQLAAEQGTTASALRIPRAAALNESWRPRSRAATSPARPALLPASTQLSCIAEGCECRETSVR